MKSRIFFLCTIFVSSFSLADSYCYVDFDSKFETPIKKCVSFVENARICLTDNNPEPDTLRCFTVSPGSAMVGTSPAYAFPTTSTQVSGIICDTNPTTGNGICGRQDSVALEQCDSGNASGDKHCTCDGLVRANSICVNKTSCSKLDTGTGGSDSLCQFLDPCVNPETGVLVTCPTGKVCYKGACEKAGEPNNSCIFPAGTCTHGTCNTSTGTCPGCLTHADCGTGTPETPGTLCNTVTGICDACNGDAFCLPAAPICSIALSFPTPAVLGTCGRCQNDTQCSTKGTEICNTTSGKCDGCRGNSKCGGTTPVCSVASTSSTSGTCGPCTTNESCGTTNATCMPDHSCLVPTTGVVACTLLAAGATCAANSDCCSNSCTYKEPLTRLTCN